MSRHSARSYAYEKLRAEWLWGADHGWICHLCGRQVHPDVPPQSSAAPTVDHLLPTSSGHDPLDTTHWRLAHRGCNSRRSNAPVVEPTRGATRRW